MKTRIAPKTISTIWKKQHPRTRLPPTKAYVVPAKTIKKVVSDSLKRRRGFKQSTKKEYGKENAVSMRDAVYGLNYKDGRTHIIFVCRTAKKPVNKILKHELEHIHKKDWK
jgi:hypothetical protein